MSFTGKSLFASLHFLLWQIILNRKQCTAIYFPLEGNHSFHMGLCRCQNSSFFFPIFLWGYDEATDTSEWSYLAQWCWVWNNHWYWSTTIWSGVWQWPRGWRYNHGYCGREDITRVFWLLGISQAVLRIACLHEENARAAFEREQEVGLFHLFLTKSWCAAMTLWCNKNLAMKGKKKVSVENFMAYVGLEIAMSFVQLNAIHDYWSGKMSL